MKRRASILAVLAVAACLGGTSQAAAGPLYDVKATWGDTNLTPGDSSFLTAEGQFMLQVRNLGDAAGNEDLVIEDKLPVGVTVVAINIRSEKPEAFKCSGVNTATAKCVLEAKLLSSHARPAGDGPGDQFSPSPSGYLDPILIDVSVPSKAAGVGTNTVTVQGGGTPTPASDVDEVPFSKTPASFGLVPGSFLADVFTDAYPFGEPTRLASDRPFELRTSFDITARTGVNDYPGGDGTRFITSTGQLRTVEFALPQGMMGNPEATPKCDPTDFARVGAYANITQCPSNTQVGYLNAPANDGHTNYGGGILGAHRPVLANRVPIYNLEPPKGVPADFGFNAGGLVQAHIYPVLDPSRNYGIKAVAPNISSLLQVRGSEVVFWGVPGDPAHDRFRYRNEKTGDEKILGASFEGAPIRPILTNPMDCGQENGGAQIRIDSYNHPGQFSPVEEYGSPLNVTGCDDPRFSFEPEIALQPESSSAGGPTGLDVHLKVPQRDDAVTDAKDLYAANGHPAAIATPPIRKAVVTLPEGMTISPSAAQGLSACTSEQIGLGTDRPVACPDSSQLGTLTVQTPVLPADKQPKGFVYVARQSDNPFNSLFAVYLVIQEPDRGILVKLAGRVDLDAGSGQIKTTFDNLPQLSVSEMRLSLKGGARAALVNPTTCGGKTLRAEFFSWHDPNTPRVVEDSYAVTQKTNGSPCVNGLSERPFGPDLAAGTLDNRGGNYSPFVLRLTRTDDEQEVSQLGLSLPPGLVAKIAGVSECPEAGVAQSIARGGAGQGALEQASPSCPDSSYVGSTDVGAGVGASLTYVPGKVYLAGAYQGAPLSMIAITPLVVGPYDLGVAAVRSAVHVDPETAKVTVKTDPLPLILQGIPARLRDIRVRVDRPETTLNPTNCSELAIAAGVTGAGGSLTSTIDDTVAVLSERFQAARCARLAFKPKLALRLRGGTKRGDHPRLKAVLRMPSRNANMARVSVALPRSEFLDQSHIRTVCTRVQFAADNCPRGSIYGFARAKSPLLEGPLKGPVYLRSSSNKLPDLVMALKGRIDVNVVGRIDTVRGGIRNTFDLVPDAPVTWVTVAFQGGGKGLLVNSRNLCGGPTRATAKFRAQNGKVRVLRPKMQNSCKKRKRKKSNGRGGS